MLTRDHRKVLRALLWLLPIGLLIVSVNRGVDPANLFHASDEDKVARQLVAGQAVPFTTMDIHQVKLAYAGASAAPIDTLVLGSSRVMEIRGSWLTEGRFFNGGVSSALLQDCVAIYQAVLETSGRPRVVMLGAEPWFFNKSLEANLLHDSLRPSYERGRQRLGLPIEAAAGLGGYNQSRYLELFSPAYFQQALKVWLTRGRAGFGPPRPHMEEGISLLPDGSLCIPAEKRNKDVAVVRAGAITYAEQPGTFNMKAYRKQDGDLTHLFETFVAELKATGVEVVLLLPPCHPRMYEIVTRPGKYPIIHDVERYYREFAAAQQIKLVGSYRAEECQCTEEDFTDGIHTQCEALKRVLRANGVLSYRDGSQ